jgi:hypothetical protein
LNPAFYGGCNNKIADTATDISLHIILFNSKKDITRKSLKFCVTSGMPKITHIK